MTESMVDLMATTMGPSTVSSLFLDLYHVR